MRTVYCAVCSVQCAVCSVQYAVCSAVCRYLVELIGMFQPFQRSQWNIRKYQKMWGWLFNIKWNNYPKQKVQVCYLELLLSIRSIWEKVEKRCDAKDQKCSQPFRVGMSRRFDRWYRLDVSFICLLVRLVIASNCPLNIQNGSLFKLKDADYTRKNKLRNMTIFEYYAFGTIFGILSLHAKTFTFFSAVIHFPLSLTNQRW